jgi:anti-anti-sigma factor
MTQPFAARLFPDVFDISIDREARLIEIAGEIDLATAPLVLAAATSFLDDASGDLTLDLIAVSFADSAFVAAVVEIAGQLDGELWLLNPTAAVKRVFLAAGAVGFLNGDTA